MHLPWSRHYAKCSTYLVLSPHSFMHEWLFYHHLTDEKKEVQAD
jgi:hypothetical protein